MIDGRVRDTVLLGRSLLDYLPQPRQPSGTLQTTPGLSASGLVPCTYCGARGRVRGVHPCASCPALITGRTRRKPAHGCRQCPVCDGSGWRKQRKGEPDFDHYAGAEIGSEAGGDDRKPWEALQDLERRLAHTTRLLALWEAPETIEFGWEETRKRMWRQGSYAELLLAIALEKQEADLTGVRLFERKIVLAEPLFLTAAAALVMMRSVRGIAVRMPPRIKVPSSLRVEAEHERRKTSLWRGQSPAHEQQRKVRDESIKREHRNGASPAEIASKYALTAKRVKQIVKGA